MIKKLAFILTVSLAACRGEAEVHYSGDASAPELVTLDIDPSVMVVANADEPIFYFENTYWLYRDNHWFRSSSHRKGWSRIDTPPVKITRIDRPLAYVHFRPSANARTTLNQRDQGVPQRPENLDQVEPIQRTQPIDQPAPPMREPNPQGPNVPMANPPPPQQVPPSTDPTLRNPNPSATRPMPPDQVPSPSPDRERNDRQIAPDPGAPISPSARPGERPSTDRKDQDKGDRSKRRPDPDKDRDSDKDKPESKP